MTGSFNDDENLGFETDAPLQGLGSATPAVKIEEREPEARSSVITARGTAEGLVPSFKAMMLLSNGSAASQATNSYTNSPRSSPLSLR